MKVEKAFVGARLLDSVTFSMHGSKLQFKTWKEKGIDGFIGYLGAVSKDRLNDLLYSGLTFMPVTYAGEYIDGAKDELEQLAYLGIPKGCTVWLDIEGKTVAAGDAYIEHGKKITKWANDIRAAGFEAGGYFGVPQPFTSLEMYTFPFTKYWAGQGSIRDRFSQLAEPFRDFPNCRGFNIRQAAPQQMFTGGTVDYNMIFGDYKGDVPSWVTL